MPSLRHETIDNFQGDYAKRYRSSDHEHFSRCMKGHCQACNAFFMFQSYGYVSKYQETVSSDLHNPKGFHLVNVSRSGMPLVDRSIRWRGMIAAISELKEMRPKDLSFSMLGCSFCKYPYDFGQTWRVCGGRRYASIRTFVLHALCKDDLLSSCWISTPQAPCLQREICSTFRLEVCSQFGLHRNFKVHIR